MSTPTEPTPPQLREHPEPHEGRHPIPVAIIAAVALMAGWAGGYLMAARPEADAALGDQRTMLAEAVPAHAAAVPDGAALYAANCVACHQADGAGLPGVFPPLAGSEWVNGDGDVLVQILLHGMSGSIDVAGSTYVGSMPAFGARLDDEQIAAITSHLRRSWGNSAGDIRAAEVADARRLTATRDRPWDGGAELRAAMP